jgi:serine/threonine protein kinase
MRTVYRRGDRSKTELIAKQVCEGSNELHILEYLHAQQPRSPHIISLIEATPRVTKEWLILPQHSRCYQHVMKHGVAGRDQLGWGLIKGLAYLHEHNIAHRDINPYNLVCDSDFQLQIIDFDLAIQIQDEDTKTDEYLGAKSDWTAHEMGDKDGPTLMHSPIRADRWACGRVLLRFILVGGGNKRLWDFADELMAIRPQQRPSLLKWHELLVQRPPTWPRWPATTARDEDMEMSEAKRPRLE